MRRDINQLLGVIFLCGAGLGSYFFLTGGCKEESNPAKQHNSYVSKVQELQKFVEKTYQGAAKILDLKWLPQEKKYRVHLLVVTKGPGNEDIRTEITRELRQKNNRWVWIE